jgi:hypothetical protein
MVKPVVICGCETRFVTERDKSYVKQTGEDNSEGRHMEPKLTKSLGDPEMTTELENYVKVVIW